jgi:hypothetical protein
MQLYRFFGIPLPPFGVGYFALCGLAFLGSTRSEYAGFAVSLLLSAALGSEFVLVWIQRFVIGKWCPRCVGIALCVVAACALVARARLQGIAQQIRSGERNLVMKRLACRSFVVLTAFFAGMCVSATGVRKPDAFAAGFSAKSVVFGKADSSSEVYIITDWFCPSCRAAEPEIVKGARLAMEHAKVVFVDYPLHQETFNYIPFNLSFMIREKEKYLGIREALAALAAKTKEPTPEDVQASVSPLGVKYVPLNYADVMAAMQYFNSVIQRFRVPGTPSVVVLDLRTGKAKTLTGGAALTADGIVRTLSEVSAR